jgi:hypothetical protein
MHTMFPDHWSSAEVVEAGVAAFDARIDKWAKAWSGRARGIPIAGRQKRGSLTTFFPVPPRLER